MTANDVQPGKGARHVSFADEIEAERSHSTQESQLPCATTVGTSSPINTISDRYDPVFSTVEWNGRTSLTVAIGRASTILGDGLCESKELKLLGVLPEPESSDDEGNSALMNTPVSERGNDFVIPATIPEDEELDDGSVSPKDTSVNETVLPIVRLPSQAAASTAWPASAEPVPDSKLLDIEAKRKEEYNIRSSFQSFSWQLPPKVSRRREYLDYLIQPWGSSLHNLHRGYTAPYQRPCPGPKPYLAYRYPAPILESKPVATEAERKKERDIVCSSQSPAWYPLNVHPQWQDCWNTYLPSRPSIPRNGVLTSNSRSPPRDGEIRSFTKGTTVPNTPIYTESERAAIHEYLNDHDRRKYESKRAALRENAQAQLQAGPSYQWWTTEAREVDKLGCKECSKRMAIC